MKVFVFVICFVMFIAAWWLFALAFRIPGFEFILFASGLLLMALACGIPFSMMRSASR